MLSLASQAPSALRSQFHRYLPRSHSEAIGSPQNAISVVIVVGGEAW